MKKYLSLVILFLTACNLFATEHHFLSNPTYRQAVNSSFTERMKMFSPSCFQTKGLKTTETEVEALQFLYAYMPLADLTDYSTSFFLANVRKSLQAQSEMAWAQRYPNASFAISCCLFASTMRTSIASVSSITKNSKTALKALA